MVVVRESQGSLVPTLGLFSTIMLVVGSMIGSGIFRLPSTMLDLVRDPTLLLLTWVIGGVFTICGALTFAELAGMFPRAGGQYVFLKESMGKRWAFLYGWSFFWVVMTGIIAAVSVVFAQFAQRLFGADMLPDRWLPILSVAVIALLSAVNYIGVRFGGLVQNVFTVAKFAALMALIVLGFLLGDTSHNALSRGTLEPHTGFVVVIAFALAMSQGFFALDGWPQAAYVASEIKNPTRNVPRGMILGVTAVTVVYLLATGVYLYLLPAGTIAEIAEAKGVISAEAARVFSGETGARLISAAVMVSTFGTVNAYILTSPRIFYALSKDGLFWYPFRKVHDAYKTPHMSILYQGLWASFIIVLNSFAKDAYTVIVGAVVFGIWFFYIPTIVGYFRLRRERPDHPRPYRTPWYPYVPILFMVSALVVVGVGLTNDLVSLFNGGKDLLGRDLAVPELSAVWATVLIASGGIVLAVWRWQARRGIPTPLSDAN